MSKKPIPEQQLKRIKEIKMFIRNYRLNESLTIPEFSKLSNAHVNTIQRFETGNKNISILTLFNFIKAMNMTLAEFFEGMEQFICAAIENHNYHESAIKYVITFDQT